ncbi:hypothetical protein TCDM_08649 [Trypanosoma cruzi Dm28c]|uniref:Uncharacterized protein n=1 Tax=Trypanosoma cruzi Dm28c TaxID=1416333 RepID=V5D7Q5_TRYCR|nr:hypothetical protein TCDM_08649 [Trypanosoma cruzi Dm28c]
MPSWHDPSRRTASMPGTWASSTPSRDYNVRKSRRKRKARTPRDRRLSVWQDSVPGVDPDIVPRVADLRTGTMRHLPTLRKACTRPADHKEPSVSVAPSLPHCGGRPASASGTSSRREHRNSLSISERRIDVLLPNLRQSALVRPHYDGTCRTFSAWRYNSLRGPPMRIPQWRHRLLNRCLARRSSPKLPIMPGGKTRRKHNAGTRDGPGFSATASSRTPRAADSPTDHGRLRLIHCGNAPLLEIGTVTVWDCLSPV